MRPGPTPLTIVAIIAIIAGSLWLGRRVDDHDHGRVPTIPPNEPYTVVDRSHPGVVASPNGRRVMTDAELRAHRQDLRNKLISLMTEAEALCRQGAADRAAGKPDSTFARITEIQHLLTPIAADTVFADVQTAATNAIETLKVNQPPRVAEGLRDVKNLPE